MNWTLQVIIQSMALLVMCRLGLEAQSRPKPALESPAEPRPSAWLGKAWGSGFRF